MTNRDILNIIEKYAELSGVEFDLFKLEKDKLRFVKEEQELNFNSFVSKITDIGNHIKLAFLNNTLSAADFVKVTDSLSFPILAFKRDINNLTPVIVKPLPGNNNAILVLVNGKIEERVVESVDELIADLFTLGEMIEHFGLNTTMDSTELGNADPSEIFFITGIPVESGTSDESVPHGHMTPMKRFFRLLKSEKKQISYLYFFAIIIGLVNLSLPLGIQAIIGLISGGLLLNSVIVLMLLVVIATAVSGWLQVLQLSVVEVLQQRIFAKAAFEFSFRIPKIKLEALHKNYAPELMNRFFDVINIQKYLPKILIDITTSVLQIVFGLLLLSFYHPLFIIFAIIMVLALFLIFYLTGPAGLKTSLKESKYKYQVVQWLEELARNLSTFKLAGFTGLPIEKMDYFLNGYLRERRAHFKIIIGQVSSIIVFKTLVTSGVLVMGGILVTERQINLGQFVAAEIIIILVLQSVEKLISTVDTVYDLLTAVEKVGHVTDLPLEDETGVNIYDYVKAHGFDIKMKNLKYKYSGSSEYALKDVSLDIPSNAKICIAGYNGSGKSTFMKILTGLLHEYEGVFTVNHMSLKDININSYRDQIGDNLSYEDVFEGTLEDNIILGKKEISLADLMYAIEKVGLSDFVEKLPDGLRTQMIAGGNDLPKTINQKIILARSIAEKPKLLVIDDFINSDKMEKKQIMDFLLGKDNDWTMVVVSNDPMIMSVSERVVFFKDGRVEAQGQFKELMQREDFRLMVMGE